MTGPSADSIRNMFSSISGRYDRANTVLSLGIHHLWRKALVRWSGAKAGSRVLDCATGTGDLAFEFEKKGASVIGTDFCEDMLVHARKKAEARGSSARFEQADVLALSFPDASFDVATISFGIRNVSDPVRGLAEMGRVVRAGGYVLVLEFGQSSVPLWGPLFELYSRKVLPRIGGWVTGKPEAYEYLQNSSAKFPCKEGFLELARKTGLFDRAEFRPLSGGIAYLYRLRRGTSA